MQIQCKMETKTNIIQQDDKIDFFDKIHDCCCINTLKQLPKGMGMG